MIYTNIYHFFEIFMIYRESMHDETGNRNGCSCSMGGKV